MCVSLVPSHPLDGGSPGILSPGFQSHNRYFRPFGNQLHPLVEPHVSHFSQVPLRTMVKFWHSPHMLPV